MDPILVSNDYIPSTDPRSSQLSYDFTTEWYTERYKHIHVESPKNTGKTFKIIAEILLPIIQTTPGVKIGVFRQVYGTIKETFHASLLKCLAVHWSDKRQPFIVYGTDNAPKQVIFDNGATITYFGLDNAEKIQGLELDIAFANEVTTMKSANDFTNAIAGLGRSGKLFIHGKAYSLLICDSNPVFPHHWYYKLCEEEKDFKFYKFTHKDNPYLYDWEVEDYTENYEPAIQVLMRIPPGFQRDRLLYGIRAGAAGAVYDNWIRDTMEVDMTLSTFNDKTEWFMAIDHGGTSPFAIELTGRNDGIYRTYRELAMSNCTIDYVISQCDALLKECHLSKSDIQLMYADNNVPAFNKALREAGYPVVEADKSAGTIEAGVDTLKQLIGEGRILINKNSLQHRCPHYDGLQGWIEEVGAYAYETPERQAKLKNPDLPIDNHNHWCDAKRYMVYGEEGDNMSAMPVDDIYTDWEF